MEIPPKIEYAAKRLKEGHRVNRITVRDFLLHFGAERRGAVIVATIREILDSLDITTDPDFETAWIDSPMWLRPKSPVAIAETCLPDESGMLEVEQVPTPRGRARRNPVGRPAGGGTV